MGRNNNSINRTPDPNDERVDEQPDAARLTDDAVEALLRQQIEELGGIANFDAEMISLLVKPDAASAEQFTRARNAIEAEIVQAAKDAVAAASAAGPAVFRCKSQVQFNGKVYEKGDEIPMSEDEAAKCSAVEKCPPAAEI